MLNDLRFAFRQTTRSPGFALAVVVTLALAIGINTAVFSMMSGFLLRPLPYSEPEKIGALVVHKEGNSPRDGKFGSEDDDSFSAQNWQQINDNLEAAELATYGSINGVNMRASAAAGGVVRYLEAGRVSAGYFDVVGIPFFLGHGFTDQEDRPGGPNAVVLSYPLWQSSFNSDRAIIGKSIDLKGAPYTVVGVLGASAVLPKKADAWTPLRITAPHGECDGAPNCGILARLKPGQSWNSAQAQLRRVRLPYFEKIEKEAHGRAWIYPEPLQRHLADPMRDRIEVLMLAVAFILAIACANLAGLMLVRMSRRTHELSTRLALGAAQSQLVRLLWLETLILALIGSAVGFSLASLIAASLSRLLPASMIPVGGIALDHRALTFNLLVAVLTSVAFGVLPAIQSLRVDIRTALVSGGRTVSTNSGRLRQWMIGAQVALSFVLLAGAGLLIRTLVHLTNLPPGFDAHNVLAVKASLDSTRYHQSNAFHQLLRQTVSSLKQIPGVENAAVGLSIPYERGLNMGFKAMDGPHAGGGFMSSLVYVTPDYFSTLRIPLIAGRSFNASDSPESQPVAVVNAAFGRKFFNNTQPLDRHVNTGNVNFTICGVVGNVAKEPGIERDAPLSTEPVIYVPATQVAQGTVNIAHVWFQPNWIVRTARQVAGLASAMGRAILHADPNLPVSGVFTMEQLRAQELETQRVEVLLLTTLAALALFLSAIGIYGTVASLVVQRKREIGIRLALGASVKEAMMHVGRSGFFAAAIGLLSGLILSLFALRLLASEIYGIERYDPATLLTAQILLGLIALGASLLPTLRISRIQLAETLMTE